MSNQFTKLPLVDRLTQGSDRSGDCWLWLGFPDKDGYGRIKVSQRAYLVHRVAWEVADGHPVPDGFLVGHTCDTPACIRNDERGDYLINGIKRPRWGHLFLCTPRENMVDMVSKKRDAAAILNDGYMNRPILQGQLNGQSKLTDSKVLQIKHLLNDGFSRSEIAHRFNVSHAAIWQIARGNSWKHVHL